MERLYLLTKRRTLYEIESFPSTAIGLQKLLTTSPDQSSIKSGVVYEVEKILISLDGVRFYFKNGNERTTLGIVLLTRDVNTAQNSYRIVSSMNTQAIEITAREFSKLNPDKIEYHESLPKIKGSIALL